MSQRYVTNVIGVDDEDELSRADSHLKNITVFPPKIADKFEHALLPHVPNILETVEIFGAGEKFFRSVDEHLLFLSIT